MNACLFSSSYLFLFPKNISLRCWAWCNGRSCTITTEGLSACLNLVLSVQAFTHKAVVHLKKLAYASADTIESLTREIEAALGKTDKNLFRTISSAPTFVSQWNQESYSKLIYPLLPLDQVRCDR
jgi:hypothetical protein